MTGQSVPYGGQSPESEHEGTGSEGEEGDSYIPTEQENAKHTTSESENASGATGQEGPDATRKNASSTTDPDRLSCTERGRGRLRDLDNHASWREVYAAMEVSVR